MLVGVILRNFKTYSGVNYIPISNGERFCGLVGNNGVGKSSVLEALDSFFNGKKWNFNVIVRRSGFETTRPHIVPIYLMEYNKLTVDQDKAKKISEYIWSVEEGDLVYQSRATFKSFREQRELLKRDFDKEQYALIPLGVHNDGVSSFGMFNTKKIGEALFEDFAASGQQLVQDEQMHGFADLNNFLKNYFEYIYIPKDVEQDIFTQLENSKFSH